MVANDSIFRSSHQVLDDDFKNEEIARPYVHVSINFNAKWSDHDLNGRQAIHTMHGRQEERVDDGDAAARASFILREERL